MIKCIVAQRLYGKAGQDFEQEMLQNRVLQNLFYIYHHGDVPSRKTFWKYKEIYAQTEVLETFFAGYVKKLQAKNKHIGNDAVIVDSSFFEAPKQRNEVHYGYKGHFLVCAVCKLIVQVFPTTARVHDAKVIDQYLGWAKSCKKEVLFFAEVGYTGKKIAEKLY